MPNIKSSAKRDALSKERNAKNRAARTQLRTNLKKFDAAVAEGDRETAVSAYKVAVKTIDHAATKNLIHKNCAANKKSKLTKKLNAMAQ
ncbi:MAG: 30S ribosomal protein S20 [Oscillospiraceae bacterium]|nr:30S ribosomal protein S20 [Oscillospiraceae bacterium]